MPSATESKPETRKVVSIVGPTASGKTGLGIAIAKALAAKGEQAEIVNADAYQMYRGMDIGTAKATPEEQSEVRHHLIDIIEPDDAMSVARFQEIARAKIAELQAKGVRPILVGGSGLYARAAIDDISFPGTDPEVRKRLEEREKVEGAGALFDELKAKDPEAAARMDPHNPRRTIRALEVIEVTGRPYSASLLFFKDAATTEKVQPAAKPQAESTPQGAAEPNGEPTTLEAANAQNADANNSANEQPDNEQPNTEPGPKA